MKRGMVLLLGVFLVVFISCGSSPKGSSQKGGSQGALNQKNIKAAIFNEQQTVIDAIVEHSTANHPGIARPGVAVLDIASDNIELSVFATEEIIMQLVKTKKFRVVDRDSIETILKEHSFQYSGVVDDKTAVAIGKFIGATVIITGVIRQKNKQTDFSLKILDVETAEIVDLISIPLEG